MRKKKKEFLSQYLLQEAKISRLKTMMKINPEFRESYEKSLAEALKLRNDIEEKIARVDGGVLSEVLYQKYIFGKTLEDISFTINYSPRHTERLHIRALDMFEM